MRLDELIAEGERVMTVCNACRYCEGYCAVFPAMERRLTFAPADLNYLANLCHGCGECYYACQYAPPHEFAINVPKVLTQIRGASYRQYAWPSGFARLFDRNGLISSLVLAVCLVLALLLASLVSRPTGVLDPPVKPGDFYAVVPHGVMAWAFGLVSLLVVMALVGGFLRFWRESGEGLKTFAQPFALRAALADITKLEYLDGRGAGCTYPDAQQSQARRWFHHLTFYGFLLCFAATCVGTLYHYGFGWQAPYEWLSVPVILGTLGGTGLLIGTAGLYWLKSISDKALADREQNGMDIAFIALLFLTSLTGLLLLGFRETAAMGLFLVVHLGVVMALFLTLPYGKFVHGIYRGAALVRYALERSRPGLTMGREQ